MADYLKLTDVARRLDVSEKTARRMVKSGSLPAVFIGGAYRISEEDLAGFLENAKVAPGKAQAPLSQRSLFNGLEEERRSSKTVTGGAHLSGTGQLTAAGEVVARIMQIMDKRREEKISDEEVVEQIRELVAA